MIWILDHRISKILGITSNLLAELLGLREGRRITIDHYCYKPELEVDAINIFNLLNQYDTAIYNVLWLYLIVGILSYFGSKS